MTFLMRARRILFYSVFLIAFIYSCWVILFKYAPDFTKPDIIYAGPIAGMLALFLAALKTHDVMLNKFEDENIKNYSDLLLKNVLCFLTKECAIISVISIGAFFCLYKFIGLYEAISFIIGAFVSIFAAFSGSIVCAKTSSKVLNQAQNSLNGGFKTAFNGGFVNGLFTIGLSTIILPLLYLFFKDPNILSGYILGICFASFMLNAGSEIFSTTSITNSKDNQTHMAACSAADNIKNAAGFGAQMTAIYVCAIVSSMVLGSLCLDLMGTLIPLTLASLGILSTIAASLFIRAREKGNPSFSVKFSSAITVIIFAGLCYLLIDVIFLPGYHGIFLAAAAGIIAGCILGASKKINSDSNAKTNSSDNIFKGFIIFFVAALVVLTAFMTAGGMDGYILGAYGISLANTAMVSTFIFIIGYRALVPLAKSTIEEAELINSSDETKERLQKISDTGLNLINQSEKLLAGSSVLTLFSMICAFALIINLENADLLNPFVSFGLLIGAMMPFLLKLAVNGSINKTIKKTENETNDQIKYIKILTNSAAFKTIIPAVLSLAVPVCLIFAMMKIFKNILSAQTVTGMLTGAAISAICLSCAINIRDKKTGRIFSSYTLYSLAALLTSAAIICTGLFK